MEQIARLSFVPLDGDPPPELDLDPLPPPEAVRSMVEAAFAPFFMNGADVQMLSGGVVPTPPSAGVHLVYVYGHAWLTSQELRTAVKVNGTTTVLTARDLLTLLLVPETASRTVLIFDCCHAAAIDAQIVEPLLAPRMVIYSCGASEKAIALNGDKASRLSLGLARELGGRSAEIDLLQAVIKVAEELDKDGVIRGQHASYRMNGAALRLVRGRSSGARRRERTVALVRNSLLAAGATFAMALIAAGGFYWEHVLIEIDLSDVETKAANITLRATVEDPAKNESRIFAERPLPGNYVRLWAPAADIILRVNARYNDGATRELAFHLDLKPGGNVGDKSLRLALPSADEVEKHPDMAYIPVTKWYHGREREPRLNEKAYWIDLRPPTVAEYLSIARALLRAGRLKRDNSFLLTAAPRSSAIDAVGIGQLRTLNKDLGAVFGAIDQGTSSTVSAPADIVVGGSQMPCPTCPAPMTRYEADLYCQSQHKRLPNDLEWELAVRGVDGRVYPWGNQFDDRRANVPGLPQKGQPSPALKPVDAYKRN